VRVNIVIRDLPNGKVDVSVKCHGAKRPGGEGAEQMANSIIEATRLFRAAHEKVVKGKIKDSAGPPTLKFVGARNPQEELRNRISQSIQEAREEADEGLGQGYLNTIRVAVGGPVHDMIRRGFPELEGKVTDDGQGIDYPADAFNQKVPAVAEAAHGE
jgi:hypothetical protein